VLCCLPYSDETSFFSMESNGLTEGIERSQPQRLTARTPAARISFKHAGTARAAFGATTVSGKMPCRYVIPITANEECATRVTLSSLAHGIVNIAGIDVMEASIPCDPSRFAQRLGRCRRSIGQFPVCGCKVRQQVCHHEVSSPQSAPAR